MSKSGNKKGIILFCYSKDYFIDYPQIFTQSLCRTIHSMQSDKILNVNLQQNNGEKNEFFERYFFLFRNLFLVTQMKI